MSSCSPLLLGFQEQICYVQCGFCTTILLVCVPCTSLLKIVSVRCGYCTGLLSVNVMRASIIPFHLSCQQDNEKKQYFSNHEEVLELTKASDHSNSDPLVMSSDSNEENDEEETTLHVNPIINKPPEKRHRAPSAYNRFIKEEIKRIKAREPNITHKEAFSNAAKNWAHFPRDQHKIDGESCNHGGQANKESIDIIDDEGMIYNSTICM